MRNRKIKILFIMVVLCVPLTILNAEGLFHDLSSVKTDRFEIDDKLPWDAIQQLLDLLYKDEHPSPKHRGICFRSRSGIIDSDSLAKVERISLVVKDGSSGWRAFERIVGESGWHYQTSRSRTQINMWPGTNFNGYDHLQHSEECKKAFKEHMIDGFELTTSYVESIDTLFREIRMKDKKFQYNIFYNFLEEPLYLDQLSKESKVLATISKGSALMAMEAIAALKGVKMLWRVDGVYLVYP